MFESIDIGILETFRGGVGRSYTQTFGSCDRTDNGKVSAAMLLEVIEGSVHHAGKSFDVGTCGVQFYVEIQFRVLETDAGAEEEEVHAA